MGARRWVPSVLESGESALRHIYAAANHISKQDVIDQLDVRIFLRVPEDVLKKRRHERHGYHTAGKNMLVFNIY